MQFITKNNNVDYSENEVYILRVKKLKLIRCNDFNTLKMIWRSSKVRV